jgi:AGZA family xanthine/uracil permease-like MFS transporter
MRLERYFRLSEHGTTVRREVRGGLVTFLTMSYIIFVQPAVLGMAGMDPGAVMTATCVASAVATLVMAFGANYPVALAPCMGENFFFVSVAGLTVAGTQVGWRGALAAVLVSGLLFLALSLFQVRERIFAAIPGSLRHAIAVGIGVFIALIGLKEGGIVVNNPFALVMLGDLSQGVPLLTLFGLALTAVLVARRIPGAILIGLVATALAGLPFGLVSYPGGLPVSAPPSLAPIALQFDLEVLLQPGMVGIVLVFLLMVLFDTIGTLTGVAEQAGLMKEGTLPRAGRALLSDAVGTTAGALLGCSTVSSYIESAAGVAEGARTGLASVVTALLFLVALFFAPVVQMVGGGTIVAEGAPPLHPVIAPVMILVGAMMATGVRRIAWDDPTESIPAFLVIVGMPFTYNIATGLALGFIAYPLIKLLAGRGREVSWLVYVLGAVFVGHLALVVHFH